MRDENKEYAYWLCNLPGVGNRTMKKLLTVCGGTPKAVYHASEEKWAKVLRGKQLESAKQVTGEWQLAEEYDKMTAQGITFLLQDDEEYPERLRNIPDAPYVLFCKGRLPENERLSVAIIGARDCSSYGSFVAAGLGRYLGERGVQIVSGMARGIDGISQEAALLAGGVSFGVLGCGVDICYPAENRKIYERLLSDGGILSTYPPGTLPRPQNFPPRNRIVSGLADVVVVIEARDGSGTLITVDMALEQGREVYAVPGRITDRPSDSCNRLIKQGAGVLLSPQDFWEEISALRREAVKRETVKRKTAKREAEVSEESETLKHRINVSEKKRAVMESPIIRDAQGHNLSPELAEVYGALDFYPQCIEQIREKLPHSYNEIQINTMLLGLCMENLAVQLSPGYFCIKAGI